MRLPEGQASGKTALRQGALAQTTETPPPWLRSPPRRLPGRARDDLRGLRLPHDFPAALRLQLCGLQLPAGGLWHPMGAAHAGLVPLLPRRLHSRGRGKVSAGRALGPEGGPGASGGGPGGKGGPGGGAQRARGRVCKGTLVSLLGRPSPQKGFRGKLPLHHDTSGAPTGDHMPGV